MSTPRAILFIVMHHVLVAAVAAATLILWPQQFDGRTYAQVFRGNYGRMPDAPPSLADKLTAWDARHYVSIARRGYPTRGPELAFYPLWPACIRLFAVMLHVKAWIAALILAMLTSTAALALVQRWLSLRHGPAIAGDALLLLLAYPGSLFFCTGYSESLFCLLCCQALLTSDRDQPWRGCIGALLSPLVRIVGVMLCVVFALQLWRKRTAGQLALCLCPMIGFGLYLALMHAMTGDAFTGWKLQAQYRSAGSLLRLTAPVELLASFLNVGSLHGYLDSALDRLAFVLACGTCVAAWLRARRQPRDIDLAAMITLLAILPPLSNRFMSTVRYVLPAFPVFSISARGLQRAPRWVFWGCVALSALLQVLLTARYVQHRWAG